MRPIDADEISKKAAELSRVYHRMYRQTKDNVWASRSDAVDHVMEMIYEAPTIEAEPVKHGRWIRAEAKGYPVKRSSIWYCSECGEKIKYNDTLGRYQKTKKTVSQVNPRCRKCGARMDGGDKNA